MSREATVQTQQMPTSHPLPQGSILQHKCSSCGQHKTGGGTCTNCQSKNGAKPLQKLPTVQTKLTVGRPNDKYEREADRVAEQIMRMPAVASMGNVGTQFRPPTIQRMCATCEEEKKLQTKEVPGGVPEVTHAIASRIQSLQGGGQPLPAATRNFFEPRFGQDFSHVRVHTDDSARALGARAYTIGHHIVFDRGEYTPTHTKGQGLIAHELVHTLQQQTSRPQVQRYASCNPAHLSVGDCPSRESGELGRARREPMLFGPVSGPETGSLVWHFAVGSSTPKPDLASNRPVAK